MNLKENRRVCVVGLGNIGLPVAQHISRYFDTVGFDISEAVVNRAVAHGIKASTRFKDSDIYVVAVNTWFRDGFPDMSAVESTCSKIVNKNALVCLESTLAVGTARNLANMYRLSHVVVCPHRWWKEDQENHGVVQLRVVGALNIESMKLAQHFYRSIEIPIFPLSSLEAAETAKIVENSHRFIQIAFSQELRIVAEANGLNYEELRAACNTKWNVDLPEARDGISGECLPKDIRYLMFLHGHKPLLHGALQADEFYRSIRNPEKIELTVSAKAKQSKQW